MYRIENSTVCLDSGQNLFLLERME